MRRLAVLLCLAASTGCLGVRFGHRWPYDLHGETGWYGAVYGQANLVVDRPFAGFGAELASYQMDVGRFWSLAPEVFFGGVMAERDKHWIWAGSLQLGLEWGFEGWGVQTSACYGLHGIEAQLFACGRWSSNRWLGADISAGAFWPYVIGVAEPAPR